MNMLKQKPRVAFVTKLWDNFYLKVGYLVTMLIALDPRGIDLAYPTEFERRSGTLVIRQRQLNDSIHIWH